MRQQMLSEASLAVPLANWLVETSLVAFALACFAFLAGRTRFLRLGPAARHALWLVVLIKMATPPLVHWPWSHPWLAVTSPPAIREAGDRSISRLGLESEVIDEPASVQPSNDQLRVSLANLLEPLPGSESRGIELPRASNQTASSPLERGSNGRIAISAALRWLTPIWAIGAIIAACVQAKRIMRFRRRLREAADAPASLVAVIEKLALEIGVRAPAVRVLERRMSPSLWCLGRPLLLLPSDLVKTLPADRWRGILAHELAHLRRGDHWTSRLKLLTATFWWWNPIYWWTCRKLDAEAELACDAWVVSTFPQERFNYAESLVQVCSRLSTSNSPALALGVAGAGRFLERRLTMILRDRVSCSVSPLGFLSLALLALVAIPSWTSASAAPSLAGTAIAAPRPAASVQTNGDDDDDDTDADDEVEAAKKKLKEAIARAKEKAKAKARAKANESSHEHKPTDRDAAKLAEALRKELGEGFEKDMGKLGEELEKNLGKDSDFAKRMEALGKELEKKFGDDSDFAKKMESFGKEMEKKFGDGSEFAKKMESFGKEMEKKYGEGSDFQMKMKAHGEEMAKKFGPDSEFAKKIYKYSRSKADDAKAAGGDSDKKARRIKELENRINELMNELKRLKSADDDEIEIEGATR